MAKKAENMNQDKITAFYCRLSVEDIKDDKDKKRKAKRTNQTVSATKTEFVKESFCKKSLIYKKDKQSYRNYTSGSSVCQFFAF